MIEEKTFGGCDPSDCASCKSNCSGAAIPRVPNPTIKLTLDDDTVLECSVLTTFDVGEKEYIALLPLNKEGKSTGEVYLFRYTEEGDNPIVTNIETEEEYQAAAQAYNAFIQNLPHEADLKKED